MKNISLCLIILCSFVCSSQTNTSNPTRDDLIGTWEWSGQDNQIFRVNLFNQVSYNGGVTLKGHYKMVSVSSNGLESEIFNSDRPIIAGTNEMFPPAIEGGSYLSWINSYKFFFQDNTSTTRAPSLGDLKVKFITTEPGEALKISWKLGVEGLGNEGEEFSVPTNIILTKVQD